MSVSRWPWRLVPAVEINLVLVTAVAFYFQSRQNRFAFGIDLLLKMDDRFNMMRASRQSLYLFEGETRDAYMSSGALVWHFEGVCHKAERLF
jgi:hypothetical protein